MTEPAKHPLTPLVDTVRWPTQADIDALRELHRIFADIVPAIKEQKESATDRT